MQDKHKFMSICGEGTCAVKFSCTKAAKIPQATSVSASNAGQQKESALCSKTLGNEHLTYRWGGRER